jgi:hypothetical protein
VGGHVCSLVVQADLTCVFEICAGTKIQLADKEYIQSMMRDGGALDIVIEEFLVAVDNYCIGLEEYNSVPAADRDELMMMGLNDGKKDAANQDGEDDFSFNSKPNSGMLSQRTSGGDGADNTSPTASKYKSMRSARRSSKYTQSRKQTEAEESDENEGIVNDDQQDANDDGQLDIGLIINEEDMEALKLEVNNAQGLAKVLLDLCMDFAAYEQSAAYMCKLRVCDGIIKYLSLGLSMNVASEGNHNGAANAQPAHGQSNSGGNAQSNHNNQGAAAGNGQGNNNNSSSSNNNSNQLNKETETTAVDLLWTVLDSYLTRGRQENKWDEYINTEIMEFEDGIGVLLDIFLRLLRDGYRLSDKECRNEVAIVLTLIINFPAASPFLFSSATGSSGGVLMTFVTYACVAESRPSAHANTPGKHGSANMHLQTVWPFFPRPLAKYRNFANSFDIDIQFKQILWMGISDILDLNDPEALLIVASSPLIPVLLSYMEHDSLDKQSLLSASTSSIIHEGSQANNNNNGSPAALSPTNVNRSLDFEKSSVSTLNNKLATSMSATLPHNASAHSSSSAAGSSGNSFIASLSIPQLREMQTQAIKFLSKNVCKVVGEFIRINGIARILDCTVKYYTSNVPEHKQMVYYSLLLCKRCVLVSNIVKKLLSEDPHSVQACLFLCEHSDEDATRSVAARLISILCSPGVGVGSRVCAGGLGDACYVKACQEQLRTNNGHGIRVLVQAMHAYSDKRKPLVGKKSKVDVLNKGDGKSQHASL